MALSSINPPSSPFLPSPRFILENNQLVMPEDSLETSHPIKVDVGHPDEINEIFDNISYEKGSSLIRDADVDGS